MPITNRDRFPNVDFLPDGEIKAVGSVGDTTLVRVGREQGTGVMVVARAYTDTPEAEDLFAVPLYELMAHSSDPAAIDETED